MLVRQLSIVIRRVEIECAVRKRDLRDIVRLGEDDRLCTLLIVQREELLETVARERRLCFDR